MSQPTGSGQQSGPESGQQSGQTGTNGSIDNELETQTGQQQQQTDPPEGQQGGQATEAEQLRLKLQAADRRAQAAETKLRDQERAKLDETERYKLELEEAKAELAKERERVKVLQVDHAFLADPTYKWKDPGAARKLLDTSKVSADDEGTVSGMKAAVDALAKQYPFLLEDKTAEQGQPTGATGIPMSGGSTAGGTNQEGMAARIPALRSRGART